MAKTYLLLAAHDFVGPKEFDTLPAAKKAAQGIPTESEVEILEQGEESDQLVAVYNPHKQAFTFDLAKGRRTRPVGSR